MTHNNNAILSFWLLFVLLVFSSCNGGNKSETVETTNTEEINVGVSEIADLTKAIEKDPNNASLFVHRAGIYSEYSNYTLAIEDIQSAIKLDSMNKDYYYILSDLYLNSASSRQSLYTMTKVVSMYPEDEETLIRLAELYLILKMYDDSKIYIDKALAINQYNDEAFHLLAIGFLEEGDTIRGRNAFIRASELDPENVKYWVGLGNLGIETDDKNTETYFLNALRLDSTDLEIKNSLAVYYQTTNRLEEAKGVFKSIVETDPRYVRSLFNLGLLYFAQDSLEKAIDHFNIAIEINKALPRGYYYRGMSYERLGNLKAALNDYQQSSIFDTDNEALKNDIRRVQRDLEKK